jgi:hypothetical protein
MFACCFAPEQVQARRIANDHSVDIELVTGQQPYTTLTLRTSGVVGIRAMAARWREIADEFDAIAALMEAETAQQVTLPLAPVPA